MGIAENKQVVSGFINALASGNVDVLNSTLADDATWWLPGSLPVSGTHRGKKGIFEGFLAKAAPLFQPGSLAIDVRNTIAEGDCVAVEWIARGKNAKGSPYENYYNVVFEVKNNKIQTVREYVDTLYAKEVLFS
jgi:uncharacterized protein